MCLLSGLCRGMKSCILRHRILRSVEYRTSLDLLVSLTSIGYKEFFRFAIVLQILKSCQCQDFCDYPSTRNKTSVLFISASVVDVFTLLTSSWINLVQQASRRSLIRTTCRLLSDMVKAGKLVVSVCAVSFPVQQSASVPAADSATLYVV